MRETSVVQRKWKYVQLIINVRVVLLHSAINFFGKWSCLPCVLRWETSSWYESPDIGSAGLCLSRLLKSRNKSVRLQPPNMQTHDLTASSWKQSERRSVELCLNTICTYTWETDCHIHDSDTKLLYQKNVTVTNFTNVTKMSPISRVLVRI